MTLSQPLGATMKYALVLCLLFSMNSFAELDLRKLQYPVEDAKNSALTSYPKFAAFLLSDDSKPRIPGLSPQQLSIVEKQYRIKVLNEYRLYIKGEIDHQEKVLLERYATRYNRQMIISLGL